MTHQEPPPASSSEVFELIQQERRALELVLERLSPGLWTRPGLDGVRSVKDMLAHIAGWERRMVEWLDASYRGLTPERPAPGMTWDDLDRLNQIAYEENKHKSKEAVRQEAKAAYSQALQAVQRMTNGDLLDGSRFAWRDGDPMWHMVAANTWSHYREHREQIEAWLREGEAPPPFNASVADGQKGGER
ncbi:MAG: ClbS/DfsB family four-helix bundle protein [Anaerolineales bacterium]|nr:ClbS/DfsB family four-helix bundle protein [Anaerolineales bacterium]